MKPLKKMSWLLSAVFITAILGGCATHLPGNPAYSWLNGLWRGSGDSWDQTFKFEVVDGNKLIGWQESRNVALGQVGQGNLIGEILSDGGETIIKVIVYKPNLTMSYTINLTQDRRNLITNNSTILRKVG